MSALHERRADRLGTAREVGGGDPGVDEPMAQRRGKGEVVPAAAAVAE
jgi:hypothetical protein